MAMIVSVLSVLAMFIGIAMGTFRHRQYGAWSLFGVLLAIVFADAAGTTIGLYVASAVDGDVPTILVSLRIILVIVVSLFVSYYCADLIPTAKDPKTRKDNIYAGILGFVNAYLIVAYAIRALGGLGEEGNNIILGTWLNRSIVDFMPWMTGAVVIVVFGWSSFLKILKAVNALRGLATGSTPSPTPSTNSSFGAYNSPSYTSPTATVTPTVAKPSWGDRLNNWRQERAERKQEAAAAAAAAAAATAASVTTPTSTTSGYGSSGYGQGSTSTTSGYGSSGYGQGSTSTTSGYGSSGYGQGSTSTTSGYGSSGYNPSTSSSSSVTPPYGIATGNIVSGATSGYSTPAPASPTSSGDSKLASSIFGPVTPASSPSLFGTPASQSSSGYGKDDDDDDDDGYNYDYDDDQPPPFRG